MTYFSARKQDPILGLVNSYVIDSPEPSNISYWWNLGSLLGVALILQIITGIFLVMHYTSHITMAFSSVEHIMRDVNYGWALRYAHANGASFFFFFVYLHIGKNIYYGSYKYPRIGLWSVGVVIFLLMIITGFLGYKNNSLSTYDKGTNTRYNLLNSNNQLIYNNILLNSKPLFKLGISNIKRSYSTKINHNTSNIFINNKLKQDKDNETIIKELNISMIKYWDNLHLEESRHDILDFTKNIAGVYIIINKITFNYYIGSAITNRLYKRLNQHVIYLTGNKSIKSSIKKYGLNNFIYGILYIFKDTINVVNNKELLIEEANFIKKYNPSYNLVYEATNNFGYKHTELTKMSMRNSFTDIRKAKLAELARNRVWSNDSKNKLSEIAKNRPADYLSDEGRKKIGLNNKVLMYIYDYMDHYVCEFYGIDMASIYFNCSHKTIQRALKHGYIYIPNEFINYLDNNIIEYDIDWFKDSNLKAGLKYSKNKTKFKLINYKIK